MNNEYDFEIDRVINEVRKNESRLVAMEFPEGLKRYAIDIANEIEEKTNAVVLICTNPVYGACDTNDDEIKRLGADLLIHFGHSDLAKG